MDQLFGCFGLNDPLTVCQSISGGGGGGGGEGMVGWCDGAG